MRKVTISYVKKRLRESKKAGIVKYDFNKDKYIKTLIRKALEQYILHEKRNLLSYELQVCFNYSRKDAWDSISLSAYDNRYIENIIKECTKKYKAEESMHETIFDFYCIQTSDNEFVIPIKPSRDTLAIKYREEQQEDVLTHYINQLFKKAKTLITIYEDVLEKEACDLNGID